MILLSVIVKKKKYYFFKKKRWKTKNIGVFQNLSYLDRPSEWTAINFLYIT